MKSYNTVKMISIVVLSLCQARNVSPHPRMVGNRELNKLLYCIRKFIVFIVSEANSHNMKEDRHTSKPVSYTHLDVYKRQLLR